jgi:hypothetical protein
VVAKTTVKATTTAIDIEIDVRLAAYIAAMDKKISERPLSWSRGAPLSTGRNWEEARAGCSAPRGWDHSQSRMLGARQKLG